MMWIQVIEILAENLTDSKNDIRNIFMGYLVGFLEEVGTFRTDHSHLIHRGNRQVTDRLWLEGISIIILNLL